MKKIIAIILSAVIFVAFAGLALSVFFSETYVRAKDGLKYFTSSYAVKWTDSSRRLDEISQARQTIDALNRTAFLYIAVSTIGLASTVTFSVLYGVEKAKAKKLKAQENDSA